MIDSHNVKALRFFKVVYTQNSEWEEVSKILRALHTSARLEGDKHRYAQELATVYLYQLDRPKKAIEVIERHCSKSHLDTSTIQFEAYSRLGNWAGCLQVLKDCLLRVSDDGARGILFFKIGELEQQLGNTVEAINSFRQSNSLVPEFLEPIESLIEISLAARNWTETVANLNLLASRVVNVDSRGRIEEVKARLEGGIASAG
jgi:tetratricopeptide (TPR) repeat protein